MRPSRAMRTLMYCESSNYFCNSNSIDELSDLSPKVGKVVSME